jgi:twitching motility two-component system response regulator PilH
MNDHPRHLLVIDDSSEFLSFMEALLTSEGFSVETAASMATARERLALARPDLVICDVRMPGLEPFSVLQLLSSDDKTRAIPVLVCTGAVQEVDEAESWLRERGAEVLFKPFDIDDLLARIERLSGDASH